MIASLQPGPAPPGTVLMVTRSSPTTAKSNAANFESTNDPLNPNPLYYLYSIDLFITTWMSSYKLTQLLIAISTVTLIFQMDLKDTCLLASVGITSWYITYLLIPKVQGFMVRKEIFGFDINKKGSQAGEKKIPQCMGFAAAVTFCIIGMILTPYFKWHEGDDKLITHLATFVTVLSTILLGFADDMLDLLWRYKLIFPFFIIIPLVSVFSGHTHVSVIYPFTLIFGNTIELGFLFHIYITLLGIYKTNTINIYAGINGLEVGQSIVAAAGMLLYFATDIFLHGHAQKYTYSSLLLICFLGTGIALMKLNAYPSQIFIGDTFCYFAGIILAVAAIYGEIPIVCHWFVIPQLINFLYSTPQLFGIVPCPRHRLTKYDPKSDTLSAISSNMNLLNLSLRVLGPTNEGKLCFKLLLFQLLFVLVPILHLLLTK